MFGNYPVNDDWLFLWQVKAFSQGVFTVNARVDPSFVSQGILGLLWSKIFGLNYISLQVLTFLVTLLTAYFVYLILINIHLRKIHALIASLLFFFNPLVFISAFTFMSDNYFLFFLSVSTFFLIKYFNLRKKRFLILGLIGALLASLTRQPGLLIFFAVLVVYAADIFFNKKKVNCADVILLMFFVLFTTCLILFWPRYGDNKLFVDIKYISDRLKYLRYAPQYLIVFLSPLLLGITGVLKKRNNKIIVFILTIVFGVFIFKSDIFPLGSVLYLEGLYSKSDFRSNFSILDNFLTKIILSVIASFGASKLLVFFVSSAGKKTRLSSVDLFLLVGAVINILILLFGSDLYDRYFLPGFFFLLIFLFAKAPIMTLSSRPVFAGLALIAFVSISLQWDFYAKNTLMWEQVNKLRDTTGLSTEIDFNDTYIKHAVVRETGDFTGLGSIRGSFDKKCFVQYYTEDSDIKFFKTLQNLNTKISEKLIENPRPLDVRKKTVSRVKNNLDNLLFNESYPSVLYGLVGKKAYVGSWCLGL